MNEREPLVRDWIGRLRGVAGLGALGGAIGAVAGSTWFAVAGLMSGSLVPALVAGAAVVYGVFGWFSATALGLTLATRRAGRGIDDLRVARAALVGCLAGTAFPVAVSLWLIPFLTPLELIQQFVPVMVRLGLAGGMLAAGMVAVAKREHRREIEEGLRVGALTE